MRTPITPALLMAVGATRQNAEIYAPLLHAAVIVPGDGFKSITSRYGTCMLVAQLAHESGGYARTTESLKFSVEALRTGNRKKYFTAAQAKALGYIRDERGREVQSANQVAIANRYYGGRLGNRGIDTQDGWDFRGGGLIQLTGRDNYEAFAKAQGISVERAAKWVREPDGAVASALWYWWENGLLIPASRGDVTRCTQIIQGADGGLTDRIERFSRALEATA